MYEIFCGNKIFFVVKNFIDFFFQKASLPTTEERTAFGTALLLTYYEELHFPSKNAN